MALAHVAAVVRNRFCDWRRGPRCVVARRVPRRRSRPSSSHRGGFQARAQTAADRVVRLARYGCSPRAARRRGGFCSSFRCFVWANLRGTVVLPAALVALRGVTLSVGGAARTPVKEWLPRGLALTLGPIKYLVASLRARPRHVLPDDARELDAQDVRRRVGPATPSPESSVLRARLPHRRSDRPIRRRLTATERLILLVTLASGLLAIRNIIWFALAAVILVPVLVDKVLDALLQVGQSFVRRPPRWRSNSDCRRSRHRGRAGVWYVREWPSAAGDQVVLAADPRAWVRERRAVLRLAALGAPRADRAHRLRRVRALRPGVARPPVPVPETRSAPARAGSSTPSTMVAFDHRTRPGLVASLSAHGFASSTETAASLFSRRVGSPAESARTCKLHLVARD